MGVCRVFVGGWPATCHWHAAEKPVQACSQGPLALLGAPVYGISPAWACRVWIRRFGATSSADPPFRYRSGIFLARRQGVLRARLFLARHCLGRRSKCPMFAIGPKPPLLHRKRARGGLPGLCKAGKARRRIRLRAARNGGLSVQSARVVFSTDRRWPIGTTGCRPIGGQCPATARVGYRWAEG